ncbi:hypothetical protein BC332_27183 [Capsicum chinense]|nr:hypothetical protein BC332_27183 [Capsicum chinense]
MNFPEINIISDFEVGVKCLHNPSLVPRFFSLEKIPQAYNIWKYGALFIAILATFSSLIRRIKLLFIYIRRIKPSAEPLLQYLGEDYDLSDDDEGDELVDQCSTSEWLSEEPDNDDDFEDLVVSGSSYYFREKGGNGHLRSRHRRNSLEKFTWQCINGNNVVKLWDSLALGLDYEYDDLSKSVVTLWDMNQEEKIGNLFSSSKCEDLNVAMSSPGVIVSSEFQNNNNNNNNVGGVFGAFDTRMRNRSSVVSANWSAGKVIGVDDSGTGKVYMRDKDDGVLTVGDMRNVKSPLELTEIDGDDTWWDADAVIVEEKFDGSKN